MGLMSHPFLSRARPLSHPRPISQTFCEMDLQYPSVSDNKRTDGPFSTERTVRSLIITNAPVQNLILRHGYICKIAFYNYNFLSCANDKISKLAVNRSGKIEFTSEPERLAGDTCSVSPRIVGHDVFCRSKNNGIFSASSEIFLLHEL